MSRTDEVAASDNCAACKHRDVCIDEEPCQECWSRRVSTGTLINFEAREDFQDCNYCKYHATFIDAEPCRDCFPHLAKDKTLPNFTPREN